MQTPAGWYPDPLGRFDHRYWDGATWTEHVSRGGQQATDPLTGATPATEDGGAPIADGVATPREVTPDEVTPVEATPDIAAEGATPSGTTTTDDTASAWASPGAAGSAGASTGGAGSPPPSAGTPPWPATPGGTTPPYHPGTVPGERRTNVQAVLSLVFSLIWILGLGSLIGIVLGAMGIRRINASEGRETGKGLAVAGIVLGGLGLLATVLFAVGLAVFARDVGLSLDDGQVTFDESALFEEDEWARWTALYDTASAQEAHWFTHDRYTSDLDALRGAGLELAPGTLLSVPLATTDAFCLELSDAAGTWHLDSDFYEVEEGPCPLG